MCKLNPNPNYKFYPSLLDKFQKLMDADETFEDFGNMDTEGNYKRTAQEIAADLEQQLLDSINRVPHEPIEAADKGTAFNELVDWLRGAPLSKVSEFPVLIVKKQGIPDHWNVKINGFEFNFNANMVAHAVQYFRGALPQWFCCADIETKHGTVNLYGYADEIMYDTVYDIKTTSRYDLGKFAKSWQKEVYPYCLIERGIMNDISSFEFTVYKWQERVGMPIDAAFYRETYPYSHEETTARLRNVCEAFIDWLELHRDQISDKKIFGLA